jgi:hypothetical protein
MRKESEATKKEEQEMLSHPAFQYLPPEIEKRLPKLGGVSSADWGEQSAKVPIIVKYFLPTWTWFVLEGNREPDGDFMFFGWVEGNANEFGYFRLSDVTASRVGAVRPERDLYFFGYLDYQPKPFRVSVVESPTSEVLKVCGNP